ncbi:MAG: PAS domain S-box protein [Acidobacteria bacterium]|nr:PAS domain S-box protein [Acidobacteriota bacterium]
MNTWALYLSWAAAAMLLAGAVISFLQMQIAGRRRWLGLGSTLLLATLAVCLTNLPWYRSPSMLRSGEHELIGAGLLLLAAALVLGALFSAASLLRQLHGSLVEAEKLRTRSERTLRRYEQIAETIPDAFVILEGGRIRFANRAFSRIFGIDREEAVGRSFVQLVDPSGRFPIASRDAGTTPDPEGGNEPLVTSVLYRPSGGEPRWLDVRLSTMGGTGEETVELALISDVTEQQREAALRRVLYEMTVEAQRAREPQELFAALQHVLDRVMDARNLFVALHDRERNLLTFPYYRDELEPDAPDPIPPGKTLTAYVLRTGRPLFVNSDAFQELHERGEVELVGPSFVDWIGVPLVVHGETAGVLAVQSYSGDTRFGEYEQTLLTVVAGHLARLLELRDSERHYRAIFDHSPAGIFHFDRQLRVTDCNERMAVILDSTRERLIGLELGRLQDRRVIPVLEATLASHEGSYEGWYEPTTGRRKVWLSARTAPLFDEAGRVAGGVAIVEDQTSARMAEEELRRRDAIIEALSSVGQRFLSCQDPDEAIDTALAKLGAAAAADRVAVYRIIEPEPGRHEILQVHDWTADGVAQSKPASPEIVDRRALSRWAMVLRQGRAITGPVHVYPEGERDGLAHHGLRSLALIPVPVADRWWGLMAFEDHRKERYWFDPEIEALRLAAATMGAAIHHRETEQRLRTVEKMEAIGQLTSGIAHDFNNLLMAVRGAVEQLKETADQGPPSWSENLNVIDNATSRATAMTRRLLAFARRQVIEPTPLDLNELLERFLPTARRIMPENIDIDHIPGAALGSVLADSVQIEQILMNLLVNGRDAMPEGGRITVETENVVVNGEFLASHPWAQAGRYVLLTVSDTGHGMDENTLSHVFEPFFSTKKAGAGTGLGLATVYGIVKQHGGMVHLYSELNRGTTVKIYLPIVQRRATSVGPKIEEAVRGGTETLLLAEDDPGVRQVVCDLLTGLGYTVLVAEDGRRALEVLEERDGEVDLVISDVIMPHMGGKELADAATGRWPGLRFLFMTGYSSNAIHNDFVKKEGISFLTKPFGRDELARKVRGMLAGG